MGENSREIFYLYELGPVPALNPIMHVGFLSHVLSRVPFLPCYMDRNEHLTISRGFAMSSSVQLGCADRLKSFGDGNRFHEVNTWMWKVWQRNVSISHCIWNSTIQSFFCHCKKSHAAKILENKTTSSGKTRFLVNNFRITTNQEIKCKSYDFSFEWNQRLYIENSFINK